MRLADIECTACRSGEPGASDEEIRRWLEELRGWKLAPAPQSAGAERGPGAADPRRLTKTYRFAAFADALLFTTRVGALAESQGHHPEIVTAWARVTVSWWTHAIGGLHRNDFVMAARTDELYSGLASDRDENEGPD